MQILCTCLMCCTVLCRSCVLHAVVRLDVFMLLAAETPQVLPFGICCLLCFEFSFLFAALSLSARISGGGADVGCGLKVRGDWVAGLHVLRMERSVLDSWASLRRS